MKKSSGYITSTPNIMGGTPVIAGTRVPIAVILYRLKEGRTLKDIHKMYPWVELQKLEAVLDELANKLTRTNIKLDKLDDQTILQAQTAS